MDKNIITNFISSAEVTSWPSLMYLFMADLIWEALRSQGPVEKKTYYDCFQISTSAIKYYIKTGIFHSNKYP